MESKMETKPPFPPFTRETATQKVRMAEDAWNTKEPGRVALAYTLDSKWRNRTEFPVGRAEIEAFLTRKWAREIDYRLIKELWAFEADRIAVRFAYEWRDEAGQWFRSYGNENWEFDAHGLISFLRLCKIAGFYNSRIAEERVFKDLQIYGSGKKRGIDEFLEVSGIKEMTKDVVYIKYVKEFIDKI